MGLTVHRTASRSAPTYRAAWQRPARQLGLWHRLAGTASARASASAGTQAHSRRLGCRAAEASRTSRHLARPVRLASTGTASRACSPAPGHRPLQHFHASSSIALQQPRHKARRLDLPPTARPSRHKVATASAKLTNHPLRKPAHLGSLLNRPPLAFLRFHSTHLLIDPLGALCSRRPQTPSAAAVRRIRHPHHTR